jgi:hypothetical protein
MRGLKYITTPLIVTTSAVCELKVFEPAVAKSCHADQGPDKLEAVQYILSFGACDASTESQGISPVGHTPLAFMGSKHKVSISALIYCRYFIIFRK